MGDEAYALSQQYDGYVVDSAEFVKEVHKELRRDSLIYAVNKKKKVGELCTCAGSLCNRTFKKKSYQQAFCRTKCKDQFWNRVRFWRDESKVAELVERIDESNYGTE
jgi:hypothetical protein